jgi:integrase
LQNGQGLVVSESTSSRGRRQIVLGSAVIDAFRRWKVQQIKVRLLAGSAWDDTGYCFTTNLGRPMEQRNFNHYFTRRADELGLPTIRVHDLRHTCATMLLAQRIRPKIVQEMLGHS